MYKFNKKAYKPRLKPHLLQDIFLKDHENQPDNK